MRSLACEPIRDELPVLSAGRLDRATAQRIEAHLAVCDECRDELDLLSTLRRYPVDLPAGLEARVRAAVHETGWSRRWPVRRLALAASIAVALIAGRALLGTIGDGDAPEEATGPGPLVAGHELIEPFSGWPAVDGLLAGAVGLEGLSNDDLELLIAELGT